MLWIGSPSIGARAFGSDLICAGVSWQIATMSRQLAAGDGVDRQHDQVDALALDDVGDRLAPAEHLAAVDQHAVLADVVVHEPDDVVALAERAVLKLPAEMLAGVARPDDQDAGDARRPAAPSAVARSRRTAASGFER